MGRVVQSAVTLEHSGFSISGKFGFKLFEMQPCAVRQFGDKIPNVRNVRIARQLDRSNIVCYVNGPDEKYAENCMVVFDTCKNADIVEITTPPECGKIVNIQVCQNSLAIFNEKRLFCYKFPSCQQIRKEEIRQNPNGLSAMSYEPTTASCYLAFPGYNTGTINILNLSTLTTRESKAPVVIEAHVNEISQVALNCQGTLVATGSTKGTVIRVFDARNKAMLYDLRRGTVPAHLHCLAFSPCSSFLAVASDKGTLHVFGIRNSETKKKINVLNMGTSSLAKIQLERPVLALGFTKQTPRYIQSLVAICADGTYWRYPFSKDHDHVTVHQKDVGFHDLIQMYGDKEFFIQSE
ncbi:unnamed protein product [Caenorhabditis sp. 36 PRJEB53466]|nr:unnamed protein product [Caenorhabditis sp. 36 PRJEB53466]